MYLLELVLSPLNKYLEVDLPGHTAVVYFIFVFWDTKYLILGYPGYTRQPGFAI